jgi:hypothetical protein
MPNTILKRWNGSTFEELYPKTTVTQLSASGTANSTTFLRGDGQWQIPATQAHTHAATDIVSGQMAVARLGTGTPTTSTFLRGDGQWVAPSGSGDVVGPTSAVSGRVATFNGTTGKIIQDGGVLLSNLVSGPASSVTARIATFDGTTGKIIQDSGTLISGLATSTHVHGNITNAGAIGGTAHRLPITGTSGVLTTLASSGSTQQVLLSNGGTSAPAFGYLGNSLSADAVTSTTANTWTTAFEMSLPEGRWQIDFNGAWSRTNTTTANTFGFSAVFNQASFPSIVGSGFYGITNSATSFTNYALDHSSATDGVASSGFTTTSATTSVTNGRIQFSAYVISTGTNILRIRIRSSVASACRLKLGSGFTAIRVG